MLRFEYTRSIFFLPVTEPGHTSTLAVDTKVILEKGTQGVLPCKVDSDIAAVWYFWSKGPTIATAELLLAFDPEDNVKQGSGYETGFYDMDATFSLIINNVRVEDNDNFFCEISELGTGTISVNQTKVVVFGKSKLWRLTEGRKRSAPFRLCLNVVAHFCIDQNIVSSSISVTSKLCAFYS